MTDEDVIAAVIVPCGGSARSLARCLHALSAQSVDFAYRTIVVDSFNDPDVARCTASFEFAALVRAGPVRLGPGPARNLGARSCGARYLVFCDADCAPERDWLAAAVAALERGAVAVTGPVSDLEHGPIAVSDNLLQFVDFSARRAGGAIAHGPGCNLAMRRDVFVSSGEFPDGLGEDVRLCEAVVTRFGTALLFEPRMRQRHAGRGTLRGLLAHHWAFGNARGEFALRLGRQHERLGHVPLMIPVFALRRYAYLVSRTIRLDWRRSLLVVALTPLLLAGLFAWACGFRRGCLARVAAGRP